MTRHRHTGWIRVFGLGFCLSGLKHLDLDSINFIVSSCAPRVTLLSASNASRLSPAKSAVTKTG
ncbi:unnamed protein product [Brassica oleracea var. botrytis]